jgi:hypothetical protein
VAPPIDGVCEECGFDYDHADADLPDRLRGFGRRYRAPLTRFLPGEEGDALIRAHPLADTWSALEYACHVRDVFPVQQERLEVALVEDHPTFPSKGMWRWPEDQAYNADDPAAVLDALATGADALAALVATIPADGWERPLVYSYPEPADRTVLWLVRHTVHEGHHHLLDVGRVLRAARGR